VIWDDWSAGWLSRIPPPALATLIEDVRRVEPHPFCPTCSSTRPPEPVRMKFCSRCGEDRPVSAFYAGAGRRDGLDSMCAAHRRAYNKPRHGRPAGAPTRRQ